MGRANGSRECAPDDKLRETHHLPTWWVSLRSTHPTKWLHLKMMRPEQPALFHHQHHAKCGQRAEEEAGRERQQRAVVILADGDADADAEQRGDRSVQR